MKKAGFIFLLTNTLLAIAKAAYGAAGMDIPPERLAGAKQFDTNSPHAFPVEYDSAAAESIRSLTSAEQLALSYALNSLGYNQTSEISYNIESISEPSIVAVSDKRSGALRASSATTKQQTLKVDIAGEILEIPMPKPSKQKIAVSKAKKGRKLAEDIEDKEVELDVSTGVIDTLSNNGKTGTFACVTQAYNVTTKSTTVNGIIWTNSSITTIKTYEIDGTMYKVALTTPHDVYEKGIKPHKHVYGNDTGRHAIGRLLSIPTLGGKPLTNLGFAFTASSAQEVGDPYGYAINAVETAKNIYQAQGITGFAFKVAKIFIGQSTADIQKYGRVASSWQGMSWAGRFISGQENINVDAVHAILSSSELEPGIGGIAYVGCWPYIFQGKILNRNKCASASNSDLFSIEHELFGHLLGAAGHEKRYNINQQYYDPNDPFGAAFAYVSPDEQYGTIMSYHYPLPRFSQNGAAYQGATIGSRVEDNVRVIKLWLPRVIEWRNYVDVTDGPTLSINPTKTPTFMPPTIKPTSKRPTRMPSRKPTSKVPTRKPTSKAPTGKSTTFLTNFPTKFPTKKIPSTRPTTHAPTFDQTPTLKTGQTVALKYTGAVDRNFILNLDDKIITFKPGANNVPVITVQQKVGKRVTNLDASLYYLDPKYIAKLNKLFGGDTVFKILQADNGDGTYSTMLSFDSVVTKTVRGKPVTTTTTYPLLTLIDKTNGLNISCGNPQYVQVSGIKNYGRLLGDEYSEDRSGRGLTTVDDDGRINVAFSQMRDWQPNSSDEKDIAFTAIMDIYARSPEKLYQLLRAITDYTLDGHAKIEQYDEFMANVMPKILSRASSEVIDEFIHNVCERDIKDEHKEGYKCWIMDFVEKSKPYREADDGSVAKHHHHL